MRTTGRSGDGERCPQPLPEGVAMRSLSGSPVDRLLTACLIIAPVIYLIADLLYAARGWDDPAAAVFHILGAIGYAFVVLRLVTWTDGLPAALLLVVGLIGAAGNVA